MTQETTEQERDRLMEDYQQKLIKSAPYHERRAIVHRLALLDFKLEREGEQ